MDDYTDTKAAKAHFLEDQVAQKEHEDAIALEHIAPEIPLQEVMNAHLDEDKKRVRRLLWKIDLRLVTILALIYVFAFIDRGNLGNANIAGMSKDLKLTIGNRYSILSMIFFVGYILIDIPATIIMRKIGPALWIASIALAWGAITIGEGFVKTWGQLVVCRVLLGFLEGGLIPGAMYLLSVWYPRYEAHKRLAAFYVVGIASSGLSGLLAYGIEKMEGTNGIRGWRWIYIIEGVVSCAIALASFFIIVDFPERAAHKNSLGLPAFLTPEEAAIVLARIERDRGDTVIEELTLMNMLKEAGDWKVWEFSSYVMFNNTALYAFSYFLPVILQKGFGYSTAKAQVYTFPPYAVSVPWVMFVAWLGDKYHFRGPLIIGNACLYIIGVTMVGYCKNVNTRYGGVFLGVLGITGNIPTNWAYQHNNTVGQSKRALCAAFMTAGGAIGGIIAGNVFQAKDSPNYRPGLTVCIVFQAINIVLVLKNFWVFSRNNRKAERGEILIEKQPGFRYTY